MAERSSFTEFGHVPIGLTSVIDARFDNLKDPTDHSLVSFDAACPDGRPGFHPGPFLASGSR